MENKKKCLYQDCVYNNLLICEYSSSLGCVIEPLSVDVEVE